MRGRALGGDLCHGWRQGLRAFARSAAVAVTLAAAALAEDPAIATMRGLGAAMFDLSLPTL